MKNDNLPLICMVAVVAVFLVLNNLLRPVITWPLELGLVALVVVYALVRHNLQPWRLTPETVTKRNRYMLGLTFAMAAGFVFSSLSSKPFPVWFWVTIAVSLAVGWLLRIREGKTVK